MGDGDLKSDEIRYIHDLFVTVAEYLEIDLTCTEYEDLDVKPVSIHREKDEHREAVYVISDVLTEELDESSALGTWKNSLGYREPSSEYDTLTHFSNTVKDEIVFKSGSGGIDVTFDIYKKEEEESKWSVLDQLSEGAEIKSSLKPYVDDVEDAIAHAPYRQLVRHRLEEGRLPKKYRNNLKQVLNQVEDL